MEIKSSLVNHSNKKFELIYKDIDSLTELGELGDGIMERALKLRDKI